MGIAGLLLLTFRTLQAGSYASQSLTAPQMVVARDAVTLRNAWNVYVRQGESPPIDFKKETAVFLFAGRKNTGGYSVVVKSVKASGKQIVIDAAIKPPPPDSFTTQALTSPFVVIAIAKPNATSVRWVDGKKAIK